MCFSSNASKKSASTSTDSNCYSSLTQFKSLSNNKKPKQNNAPRLSPTLFDSLRSFQSPSLISPSLISPGIASSLTYYSPSQVSSSSPFASPSCHNSSSFKPGYFDSLSMATPSLGISNTNSSSNIHLSTSESTALIYPPQPNVATHYESNNNRYNNAPSLSSSSSQSYLPSKLDTINSIPQIPDYSPLVPIYPHYEASVSMYRATRLSTGQNVLIKASSKGTLQDLTRIRHEWSVASYPTSNVNTESNNNKQLMVPPSLGDIDGILTPESCIRVGSNPPKVILTYLDQEGLMTLHEKFIPKQAKEISKPIERSKECIIEILEIICGVVAIIAQAHSRQITHNGLTSSSIFVGRKNKVYVAGWDFSFPLKVENSSRGYRKTYLNRVSDCLGFVSPEATGLAHRLVDFRSDFYSIGCILYELLVGQQPFLSSDPFDLIRMHVLRTPTTPHTLCSWIPKSLSLIILKLLEKNADDRYQASNLLLADLQLTLNILKNDDLEEDEEFVPNATPRVSPIFLIPQNIYGRDEELSILRSSYKQTEKSRFQMLFVTGEPGSGKTRLVNELERSSFSRNGFFCVSKFDPYQRGPPFYSIVTVLKDIVHQILCGSVLSITQWRDNIISNLKVDLAVLFDPIPELKDLLGHEYAKLLPQPRLLGPVPRELRFKYVVKSLFCLLGAQGLTIFLDDIQWCPRTEMGFFRELASFSIENYPDVHITFICASIPDSARVNDLITLSKDLKLHHEIINLNPLRYEAVEEMIHDVFTTCGHKKPTKLDILSTSTEISHDKSPSVLRKDFTVHKTIFNTGYTESEALSSSSTGTDITDNTDASDVSINMNDISHSNSTTVVDPQVKFLAQKVYKVTKGNPLFITLIMQHMHHRQLIYYDPSTRSSNGSIGKWRVHIEQFELESIPESLTDAVVYFVSRLPANTISILKYAACICSNSFTLDDLAKGANVSYSEAANALHMPLDMQLLLPTTMHYKFPFPDPVGTTMVELDEDEVQSVAAASTYRFYHDLVQQSVYSLISHEAALETHKMIGFRLLGQNFKQPQEVNRVIEISNQLKNSISIVTDEEREIYINLIVRAGDVVYGMSDFDMAYFYFDTARQLLPPNHMETFENYSRHIFLTLVELQYNRKNFQECLDLVDKVFPIFKTNIDKAALLKTKTKAQFGLYKPEEAITTGIFALNLLGWKMQEDESWNEKNHAKLRHRIPLALNEIRELVNRKQTQDPVMILAQEIISILTIPIILSYRPHLFRSLIYTSVTAFVRDGATASCSFSLLSLASLFQRAGDNTNLLRAYEYSKLAIVTLEFDNAVGLDFGINIYEYYALTLAIYFEPLSEVIRYVFYFYFESLSHFFFVANTNFLL